MWFRKSYGSGHLLLALLTLEAGAIINTNAEENAKDKPIVRLTVNSRLPVIEGKDITLTCSNKDGNTESTIAVRWYFNGYLLRELPDCSVQGIRDEYCDADPSKLYMFEFDRTVVGKYACQAKNNNGWGPLSKQVEINVDLRPWVQLTVDTPMPVREGAAITLTCTNEYGNTNSSIAVRWYLNGYLFKELPDCSLQGIRDNSCDAIPSVIFIPVFDRSVVGKYSCQAKNDNGWGPLSKQVEINVDILPRVKLSVDSSMPVREGAAITMTCSNDDGNSELPISVRWYLNGLLMKELPDCSEEGLRGDFCVAEPSKIYMTEFDRTVVGYYACQAKNKNGWGPLSTQVEINVDFRPKVKLTVESPMPLREGADITLTCSNEDGNSEIPFSVSWYIDGELLMKLPDCSKEGIEANLCLHDPRELILHKVYRAFTGNYSCQCYYRDGWGTLSKKEEIVVQYPPGRAEIVIGYERGTEERSLAVICRVADPGRPAMTPNSFKWFKGGRLMPGVSTGTWTIDKVTNTNEIVTCLAFNQVGEGKSASVPVGAPGGVEVKLTVGPPLPRFHEVFVVLICGRKDGIRERFPEVRWYANGKLFLTLPDCSELGMSQDQCRGNPGRITLLVDGSSRSDKYSCQGKHLGGWGPISEEEMMTT